MNDFVVGFVKRAMEYGLTEDQAVLAFQKHADYMNGTMAPNPMAWGSNPQGPIAPQIAPGIPNLRLPQPMQEPTIQTQLSPPQPQQQAPQQPMGQNQPQQSRSSTTSTPKFVT